MVEDVDLLVRRAERCLEAGADMIMINADDLCRQAGLLRSDIVAKIVGRLGLEKTMFEASNPKISEWFVKRYGPKVLSFSEQIYLRSYIAQWRRFNYFICWSFQVNLIVDHSQVMDLECLRGRNLGQNHSSVLGRSYFLLWSCDVHRENCAHCSEQRVSVKCFAGHVQIMFELLNEKKGEYTSDMYSCTVMIAVFSGTSFFFFCLKFSCL